MIGAEPGWSRAILDAHRFGAATEQVTGVNMPERFELRGSAPALAATLVLVALSALAGCGAGATRPAQADEAATSRATTAPAGTWVGSWMAAQQVPEPRNALSPEDLDDATLRQVLRASLGGEEWRLRLSNVYGTEPLVIDEVSIARSADPASSGIEPGSARPVTFSGSARVSIPAGAYMLSDAFGMPIAAGRHVAVSLHYPLPPARQTGHPGSRSTSYLLSGNHVARESLPQAQTVVHWYQVAGLDVRAQASARALVVLGDSITDGFGVQPDSDRRWTDFLAARVREDPELEGSLSVLNAGLGGNRMLLDGLGPNGLARFDRDVLGRAGVRFVIVALGVNDLGMLSREEDAGREDYDELVGELITAYRQVIARAREHDIRIIGATIMPFRGSSFYPSNELAEAARQRVNAWIRQPGHFDDVIDFDARMRSAGDPTVLDPELDSGDHLHPSIAGYRAMAEFVPLGLFKNR